MTRPLLKVCGVTDAGFAAYAASRGADILGMVFASRSPRRVDLARAEEIASAARMASPEVRMAGVFAGAETAQIVDIARAVPLDIVQLHDPRYTAADAAEIAEASFEIWALSSSGAATVSDAILFDGRDGDVCGGTGRLADWDAAAAAKAPGRRVVLAGGIGPRNILAALAAAADIIDVNSAIEISPGVKDRKLFDSLSSLFSAAIRDGCTSLQKNLAENHYV